MDSFITMNPFVAIDTENNLLVFYVRIVSLKINIFQENEKQLFYAMLPHGDHLRLCKRKDITTNGNGCPALGNWAVFPPNQNCT